MACVLHEVVLGDEQDVRTTTRELLLERIEGLSSLEAQPFFLIDLGTVRRQFLKWKTLLPRVEPFYAVKCNNDGPIVQALLALGAGFDVASMGEIAQVKALGVNSANIIYANPCKQVSHLIQAAKAGVEMMTFDCADELLKIKATYPSAKLVLRLLVDDQYSVCKLGLKFGVPLNEAKALLECAKQHGLNVIGVSFHVGSGCQNAKAYQTAITMAADVFATGKDLGFDFTLLDIGGGFPGTEAAPVQFDEIAEMVNKCLDHHFPAREGVRVIGEPGRYMVCASHTEACPIISRRAMMDTPRSGGEPQQVMSYYINDGVYGSFNSIMYDHAVIEPKVLKTDGNPTEQLVSTIWGPTCDSMDKVVEQTALPKLELGDWLYFEDMGAYTCAASSTFNGFERPDKHYIYTAVDHAEFVELPIGFFGGSIHDVPENAQDSSDSEGEGSANS